MLCKYPTVFPNTGREVPLPCGQCIPCRINKRRVWTHRMMLEMQCHASCSFLTITYSDENLPKDFNDEETGQVYYNVPLNPAHHKRFINSLRKAYFRKTGQSIRFFMCGEYGEKTGRPHYHYALFGFPSCVGDGPRTINGKFLPCSCPNCSFVSRIWGKGHIVLGTLTQESAQYVCGYVTKKLTNDNSVYNSRILVGRYPEFSRQSRRNGLGYNAIVRYAQRIKNFVRGYEDIPPYLIHNSKKWPLGRYLYDTLIKAVGLPPLSSEEKIEKYKDALLEMFEDAEISPLAQKYLDGNLPASALELINSQRVLQIEKQHDRNVINKNGV